MQPKDWLTKFLTADRELNKSHGRPLYRYRMSDAEFISLQEILKTSVLLPIAELTKISGWNAAFVIYAAEWWRRHYDGGKWSWERIFASFDAHANEINTGQLYLAIELGLGYWQREVRKIDGRSRYLGTIATEGGLPLKQLEKADNWLSKLFKHAIPKYLRLQGNDIIRAIDIIREYAEHLPKNYQNDQIYAVLGDMVYSVAKLKTDYQLTHKENPIAYLTQHIPDWREQFPLPIEDKVGLTLLTGMIETAAKVATFTAPFRGRRVLSDNGKVHLTFEFAATVELEKITSTDNFPARVTIEIVSEEGKTYPVGIALKTTVENKDVLKMPRCSLTSIENEAVTQGYTLRFKQLSEIIEEQPLIEPIDDSVPWTFILDNDEWLLVGTASVRTRAKQVRILYGKDLTCSADNRTELVTLPDKKLIEASGIIELRDTDNSFHIQTAQAQAVQRYYLRGKTLEFSCLPKTVYLGLPELYCFNTETERSQKINTPLLARAVNSKADWQKLTAEQQGIYELRLQDEQSNILFRKKCALLPKDFALRFLPVAHSFNGSIAIEQSGQAKTSCISPFRCDIHATPNGYSVEFNANDTPPSFVDLTLDWQGMAATLTLTVPYPVRSGVLIDAEGNKLSNAQVDNLYGVRLCLLGENHHHKRHLQLEFRLKDDLLDTNDLYFRDTVTKTGAVIELAMIDYQQWIKELLAISHHADSSVRLTVSETGTELLRTNIVRSVQPAIEQATKTNRRVSSIDEIKTLDDARTIRDDELRQLFIRHRLKQLCLDFTADDWKTVRKSQNDMPLVENELWTAAILENRVLVVLVMQLDSEFMQRFVTELPVFWELIPIRDWLVIFSRYKNYLAQAMDETDVKEFLTRAIDKISAISQSLEIVAQLLKCHLLGITDDELRFMRTDNALLSWLIPELKKEQQELITRHPNVNDWLNFLNNELNQYGQIPSLQALLAVLCYRDGREINKMRLPAILLPLVLAHFCLTPTWQGDNANTYLFKLRRLKAFDDHWFNTAFRFTLTYLSQQPDYQQRLQQETEKMINDDENDLIPEIEQELALAHQTTQDLATDVRSFKDIQEQLDLLAQENADLNKRLEATVSVEKFNEVIKKRDDALRMLLGEVKKLHEKIREIRSEINAKANK